MITLTEKPIESVALSSQETEMARQSGQAIANFANGDECLQLTISRATGEQIEAKVPARAVHLLAYILEEMAKGNPVTLVPKHAELSTIQAAELMRVSRPYFVKLLEEGKIPFRLVGAHRRVRYDDLLEYMEQEKKARKEVLKELIAEQERLGLYE
jgi:excisionase family DNA binding protein